MKKLIPILALCLAILCTTVATIGLITMAIAVRTPQVELVAVPTALVGSVLSVIFAPLAYLFKKAFLCKIAFFIDLGAFVVAAAAIAVWIIAM